MDSVDSGKFPFVHGTELAKSMPAAELKELLRTEIDNVARLKALQVHFPVILHPRADMTLNILQEALLLSFKD